ncbi:MAG: DUF6048 family protein [Reichenbachiella sp.]|uniref:DUF6048 family protein n=1 Tax=Reichenbachiella sp. TaxID=2184521 RepID=UPI003263D812
MKILKYTASLILVLNCTMSWSQELKKDYKPSEILFAADIIDLGKTFFTDETRLEFHSKIDFHQFYLTGEFGVDKFKLGGDNYTYTSEGSFFRIGPQVNLMPYNLHRSSIFFGLMYARSSFNDQINYDQSDAGWGGTTIDYKNDNMSARWFEANVGINVKIAGPVYLGYTVRFKFSKALTGNGELFPYEIPGYGEADKGSRFGFNYYLIYKLRFRNKPVPKRPIRRAEEPENVPRPEKS